MGLLLAERLIRIVQRPVVGQSLVGMLAGFVWSLRNAKPSGSCTASLYWVLGRHPRCAAPICALTSESKKTLV